MLIEAGSKLVMIGDSVTDTGRAQPIGEGAEDALGRGYVSNVDALLGAVSPELGIRVVNMGTSGHTARDLKARWQRDVLDLQPDWLSIMIGINDVWRQFDSPDRPEVHVYIEEYEATLHELVEQTRPSVRGLVLMTPFYIEPNREDAMRAQMDRYGAVARGLAPKYDAIFVDTQDAFDMAMQHIPPAYLAGDKVHPSQIGHMVLTRAFLNGIEFEWK